MFFMQPQEERRSVLVILVMLELSWVSIYDPVTFSSNLCLMEITSTPHPQSDNLTKHSSPLLSSTVQRIFDHNSVFCTQYISMKMNSLGSGLFVLLNVVHY